MPYIHKIFEKATIRSVADYLLFGLGPDEDTRNYEERLDELYNKFEEAVRKYDSNPTSELLDLSNELSSETASVYTEIGLQLGVLLVLDVVTNLRCEKDFVFCQVLFPEKSVGIPFFQQGIFPAFSGHYASLRMRACSIR